MAHRSHETLGRLAYVTVQLCFHWEKSCWQQNGRQDAALKPVLNPPSLSTCHYSEISSVL